MQIKITDLTILVTAITVVSYVCRKNICSGFHGMEVNHFLLLVKNIHLMSIDSIHLNLIYILFNVHLN